MIRAFVVAGLMAAAFAAGYLAAWRRLHRYNAALAARVNAAEAESARLRDVIRHEVGRRRGWAVDRVTEHAVGAGRAAA